MTCTRQLDWTDDGIGKAAPGVRTNVHPPQPWRVHAHMPVRVLLAAPPVLAGTCWHLRLQGGPRWVAPCWVCLLAGPQPAQQPQRMLPAPGAAGIHLVTLRRILGGHLPPGPHAALPLHALLGAWTRRSHSPRELFSPVPRGEGVVTRTWSCGRHGALACHVKACPPRPLDLSPRPSGVRVTW